MFGLEEEPYRFDVVSIVLPTQDEAMSDDCGNANFQIDLFRSFWATDKFSKRRLPPTYWD
jgi:hypothetical protein